jgi:toxin HigB-1
LIASFSDANTEELFRTGRNRRWDAVARQALRKLGYLNAAGALDDLRSPPGTRLEALAGSRKGQHSIRVNDQFRICFHWDAKTGQAHNVEIVDYH